MNYNVVRWVAISSMQLASKQVFHITALHLIYHTHILISYCLISISIPMKREALGMSIMKWHKTFNLL